MILGILKNNCMNIIEENNYDIKNLFSAPDPNSERIKWPKDKEDKYIFYNFGELIKIELSEEEKADIKELRDLNIFEKNVSRMRQEDSVIIKDIALNIIPEIIKKNMKDLILFYVMCNRIPMEFLKIDGIISSILSQNYECEITKKIKKKIDAMQQRPLAANDIFYLKRKYMISAENNTSESLCNYFIKNGDNFEININLLQDKRLDIFFNLNQLSQIDRFLKLNKDESNEFLALIHLQGKKIVENLNKYIDEDDFDNLVSFKEKLADMYLKNQALSSLQESENQGQNKEYIQFPPSSINNFSNNIDNKRGPEDNKHPKQDNQATINPFSGSTSKSTNNFSNNIFIFGGVCLFIVDIGAYIFKDNIKNLLYVKNKKNLLKNLKNIKASMDVDNKPDKIKKDNAQDIIDENEKNKNSDLNIMNKKDKFNVKHNKKRYLE
jgi:hypothetical protein